MVEMVTGTEAAAMRVAPATMEIHVAMVEGKDCWLIDVPAYQRVRLRRCCPEGIWAETGIPSQARPRVLAVPYMRLP